MNITVLGTGTVGQTIAAKLHDLGHKVFVGTRDPAATLARPGRDVMGGQPIRLWLREHVGVAFGTLADAAEFGEFIVNATSGSGSIAALEAAGERNLAGKVLLDIANPLDFSKGMPPSLTICNTDSLAEQIQRRFPSVKVVKALNTMNAALMVAPSQVGHGDHSVFVSGNDAGAKKVVADLLRSFGWKDIIDLGDITTARGTEMILPLWLRLWSALGRPGFNFKIVR